MSRTYTPAAVASNHRETVAEKEYRAKMEAQIRGTREYLDEIPEDLEKEGERFYYSFIISELECSNLLGNIDQPLVKHTAIVLNRLDEVKALVDQIGEIYQTTNNNGETIWKKNPACTTYKELLDEFKTLALQLGMSPSARAGITGKQIQTKQEQANPILGVIKTAP